MKKTTINPTRSKCNILRQIFNFIPQQVVSQIARTTGAEDKSRTFTPSPEPRPPKSSEPQSDIRKAPMPTKSRKTVGIIFRLDAPQAQQVWVCGEFNKWSPKATPMKQRDGGRWEVTLALRPGRYQYKFVADRQWLHDPNAIENVPNEQGSLNSVIELRA